MKCNAEKCGTGVPPGRPFCTRHAVMIPYAISKEFWHAATRPDAIKAAVEYLRNVEAQ
jgi:hypothetical protein